MSTNTKSTVAKTEVAKTKAYKTSAKGEAYAALKTDLKNLSDEKRQRKADLLKAVDSLWKEYQAYTKNVYKVKRAEAIAKFEAVKKAAAEKRTEKKATEKPAEKKAAKKAAKKPAETAAV